MKKHSLIAALACAAALSGVSTTASAQFAKAEDAIKYRQSALFVMAQHFGRVGAMANGKVPYDAKAAELNADIVARMSSGTRSDRVAMTGASIMFKPNMQTQ